MLDADDHGAHESFWHFDWEDMGREDLPVILNYITKVTGFQKTAVIAH